jgi:5-methylcytosine-specific restriction endonuclease McrA
MTPPAKKKLTYKAKIGKERRAKKRIEKECMRLWFEKLSATLCEVCGFKAIQVHHFFPKSLYPQLKFDLENGIPICMSCHFKHHHRGDPIIHQRIIDGRGQEWYQELLGKSIRPIKSGGKTLLYLEKTLEELKNN